MEGRMGGGLRSWNAIYMWNKYVKRSGWIVFCKFDLYTPLKQWSLRQVGGQSEFCVEGWWKRTGPLGLLRRSLLSRRAFMSSALNDVFLCVLESLCARLLSRYREIWYVDMKIVWNILWVYGSVFRRRKGVRNRDVPQRSYWFWFCWGEALQLY